MPIFDEDKKAGEGMLGAIFGDIVGSVYEFKNIKTKDFELFGDKCQFTDDTVMTLAVANALIKFDTVACIDDTAILNKIPEWRDPKFPWKSDLNLFKTLLISEMHSLGEKYPYAGYGGGFGCWLEEKSTEPYGSYGNGSAMRVSPVAWYADSLEEAIDFAKASAEITHDHPEGIKGAVVTAGAAYLARTGATMEEIGDFVSEYYKIDFTLDEIRPTYRFNETCQNTVPQAIQAFLESCSFEDAIRNGISVGGDSDTLCAICGAIAGAYYGISEEQEEKVLSYLDVPLRDIAINFAKYKKQAYK